MQQELERLLDEVAYHTGEVVSDPQTWTDTNVHGGGYTGAKYGRVDISTTTTTWTSFVIQKSNGKEYMAKLPYAFPARKGSNVIAADFRGSTIAAANDATDELRGTVNVVRALLNDEEKKSNAHPSTLFKYIPIIVPLLMLMNLFLHEGMYMFNINNLGVLILAIILWAILKSIFIDAPKKRKGAKKVDFLDTELPKAACKKLKAMIA